MKFMLSMLCLCAISWSVTLGIRATRDDIARAHEESARRLDHIEADLDALKADVSATGVACQETRNRR